MSAYRLAFLLPPALRLSVAAGRQHPCVHGCVVEIDHACLATIIGPSRERVFDQARRLLKDWARGHGALEFTAVLTSPTSRDSWRFAICGSKNCG